MQNREKKRSIFYTHFLGKMKILLNASWKKYARPLKNLHTGLIGTHQISEKLMVNTQISNVE